jgi:hypothetical protein
MRVKAELGREEAYVTRSKGELQLVSEIKQDVAD